MKEGNTPIYREIVLDLQRRIRHGFYGTSGRMPSRRELCDIYGVSEMTAYKVQTQLEKEGFVRRIKGKGIFAVQPRDLQPENGENTLPPVKRILVFSGKTAFDAGMMHNLLMLDGVRTQAKKYGIEIRCEFLTEPVSSDLEVGDEDGLLVFYAAHLDWGHPLLNRRRLRKIMLNNFFPDMHCVVNDNFHGIASLLDHLEYAGYRKIWFCTHLYCDVGLASLSERTQAFRIESVRRNLEWRILTDGNYNELLKQIKGDSAPDAVMFATDYPALRFRDMLKKTRIAKKPFLTGFDGMEKDRSGIAAFLVDYEAMGMAAVDLMYSNTAEDWMLPDVLHVLGSGKVI